MKMVCALLRCEMNDSVKQCIANYVNKHGVLPILSWQIPRNVALPQSTHQNIVP